MADRYERIMNDLTDGMPWREVARKYHTNVKTIEVYDYVRRGIAPNKGYTGFETAVVPEHCSLSVPELYREGYTVNVIAHHKRMSNAHVMYVLKREGIMKFNPPPEDKQIEIRRLYEAGNTVNGISELLHIDYYVVLLLIDKWGIKRNTLHEIAEDQWARIIRDYEAGKKLSDIAKNHSTSPKRISVELKARGVHILTRSECSKLKAKKKGAKL